MISVVMPVRNGGAPLAGAIRSVLAQTWRDWELLVVDDGSTDGTDDVLTEYASMNSRIRIISTPPQGIARALQTGCAAATGEWIARMDADDLMHPQRLEWQIRYALDHPEIGLISGLIRYGGTAPGYGAHVDWLNGLRTHEEMALRRFVEAPVAHPSVMFRSELLEKHGGYRDGEFPEDYELWLRWLEADVRFGKVPDEILVWNDPPGRLSRTDPRYAVNRFYDIKCAYLARWLSIHVNPSRDLWLWGAGRVTRRRFDALESAGHRFAGFVDVDTKKVNRHRDGRPVVLADHLPERKRSFLLIGVGNRGARESIVRHLVTHGWVEGQDFLLAA